MSFNKTITIFLVLLLSCSLHSKGSGSAENITRPADFFGFTPGEDRKMFLYEDLIGYLELIATESDKVTMIENGVSPMGRPMYITFVSSSENISNLGRLREINTRLALDGNIPEEEKQSLIEEGRVFVLVTLSMHSTEVAPSQAAPLMAYNLATGKGGDPGYLEDVVFMMVPCHNPDGMNMIVEHYNEYLDTPYEGSSMPGVYHKYVGHNINRDFITLTQSDNQAVADIYNLDWFPQVLVEKHQMGSTGPRYFVPPNHDPIALNIDELVWNWTWVFGSNMARDMTAQGLKGVSQHYLFDDYWPGSTQTSAWKNVISLLTEAASVQLATPVYIEANELSVAGKGLSDYKKSINFPAPWPGGWWRLEDLVTYELESVYSLVKTASLHKREILEFRNEMCRREINKGLTEPPFYYVLPAEQNDSGELHELLVLLDRHGINLYRMNSRTVMEGKVVNEGDFIIPLAQPFRAFIKEVMESQVFPVRRYTPGGEIIRPYDITSWSLPLHRGLECIEVNTHYSGRELDIAAFDPNGEGMGFIIPDDANWLVFPSNKNSSYKAVFALLGQGVEISRTDSEKVSEGKSIPAGSFIAPVLSGTRLQMEETLYNIRVFPLAFQSRPAEAVKVSMPRIALCETNFHDMDAGWTRYLFDTYGIPYTVLNPVDFRNTDLRAEFDVIVFPDTPKERIIDGHFTRGGEVVIPFYNPEYIKGMGSEGWQNVLSFLEQGGNLVSWAGSSGLFFGMMNPGNGSDRFNFPVRDISSSLIAGGFSCPGSFLKINLIQDHPLTFGMPSEIGVFHRNSPVFATSVPSFGMDRRVVGQFPEKENIVLSGYAENEELLERQPAIVWMEKGEGQAVLFSFAPNFRGSTPVSNKLIFNALLLQ